ncbi:hypothetical protein [Leptospira sp. severe_002]|uniref:hypothetical protein n=1 Tax=Leptospira sp. severe_002 TaxID=2838237 RepID=UPI001E56C4D1|nr:hypothetical protein [Leptospira sp. severe_002]
MAKKSRNQNTSDKNKGELSLDQLDAVSGGGVPVVTNNDNAQMMTDLQLTQPNALQPHAPSSPGNVAPIETGTHVGTTAGTTATGWEATAVARTGVSDTQHVADGITWTGQAGADVDASFYVGAGLRTQAGGHAIASSTVELDGGVTANSVARADGDVYLRVGIGGIGAGVEGGVRAYQNLTQTNDVGLGGGADFHNTTVAEAGVKAEAGAHAKLSPLDGNLTVGANAFAGGYLSVGETIGVSGGGVSGSVGAAAISPGSVGVGFTPLVGVQDGNFNVGIHMAGALGLGGFTVDANFSVDTGHLVNAAHTVADGVMGVVNDPATQFIGNLAAQAGQQIGNDIAHGTVNAAHTVADGTVGAANTVAHGVTDAAHAAGAGIVGAANTVGTGITDTAHAAGAGIVGAANTVGSGVTDAAHAAGAGIVGAANTVGAGVTGAANTVGAGITDAAHATGAGIVGAANAAGAGIVGVANTVGQGAADAAHAAGAGIVGAANTVGAGVTDAAHAAGAGIIGAANALGSGATDAAHAAAAAATSVANAAVQGAADAAHAAAAAATGAAEAAAHAAAEAKAAAEKAAADAAAQAKAAAEQAAAQVKAAAEHAAAEAKAAAEKAAAEAAAAAKAVAEKVAAEAVAAAKAAAEKIAAEAAAAKAAAEKHAAEVAAAAKAAAERAAAELKAAQEAAAREAARIAAEAKAAAERAAAEAKAAAERAAAEARAAAERAAAEARAAAERAAAEVQRQAEAAARAAASAARTVSSFFSNTFCHAAGTPIAMADGTYKPVEQLKMGDETLLGGTVLGRGEVLANDLYSYRGTVLNGRHAVFEDGRWLRVENSDLATLLDVPPATVYPVVTANHLLVCEQYICADLSEMDEDIGAVGRLAKLNADIERNAELRRMEEHFGFVQQRAA